MNEYTRPEAEPAALLTIDVQNDFTLPDAPAHIPGTAEAVPRMQRVVSAFRSANRPIIHVVRLYEPDGSNVDRCRRQAVESGTDVVRPGTTGAELVDELKPTTDVTLDADRLLAGKCQKLGPREWAMYKPRWSAFFETPLTEFLAARDVTTVVVCGCNFPNCPRTTVYGASQRDYRVAFVADATSGTYDRGTTELENIDVAVMETEDVGAWLRTDSLPG